MKTILSVENSLKWSWSFGLQALAKKINCEFIRIVRIPGCKIADDLIKFFDVTLLQNLDSIHLVKNKTKVISRIGGFHVDKNNPSTRYDLMMARVGVIIATNRFLYNIGKRCNKNTYLIPNGVDLELFKPVFALIKKPRKFTIGFAGNIWGQGKIYKGWLEYDKVVNDLYGEVNHLECLYQYNQIPHKKMPEKFYHKIDCLILPSLGEGCSNVIMEALACGIPVLLTKVGYHGEMLKNKNNCLFIKRDGDDILKKVKLLKDNAELWQKLSLNGRKFAEKYHNINDIAAKYDEIFKIMIRRNE